MESWARAMNPTGVMRESDREIALEKLNTAKDAVTYRAVVEQIQKQITLEVAMARSSNTDELTEMINRGAGLNRNQPAPLAKGAAPGKR